MAKFIGLVKNEYIKNLRKISTIIMIVIVILAAAAMPLFGKGIYTLEQSMDYYEDNFFQNCLENIEYAESSKSEGWEYDVQMYKYLYDNKISVYSGWRYTAVSNYFESKKITDADEVIKADLKDAYAKMYDGIDKDDYYLYAEGMIAYNEYTMKLQGVKAEAVEIANWEYKYRIDNKSGAPKGYTETADNITKLSEVKIELYELENTDNANKGTVKKLNEKKSIYEYMLKNGIKTNTAWTTTWYNYESEENELDFWRILKSNISVISFIAILMIVIAGGIVANEFSNGTIKFLLINPAKRWKVLASKYFTIITFGYIMILAVFLISIISSAIMCGFGGTAEYLTVKNGAVVSHSSMLMMLGEYLISGIEIVVVATIAFAISSMLRSTAFSVGISLFIYFVGGIINSFIGIFGFSWGKYLIFANLDLNKIMDGNSPYFEHTLSLALIVLAVHMFTFLLMAWDGFTKKEV